MKTMDLNQYGLTELDAVEMKEVEGGIIPLLLIAGLILLSGCKLSEEAAGHHSGH